MPKHRLAQIFLIITLVTAVGLNPRIAALHKAQATANFNVAIQNEAFNPPSVTVHVGDNVVWANMDPLQYELYFQDSQGNTALSPFLKQGDTYIQTFTKCATVQYVTIQSAVTITGSVKVLAQGDVTGDSIVDISDIVIVASHNGANRGSPQYLSVADLNQDGTIDISDLVIVASHQGSVCP